jgi:hypothetical protein
MISSLFLCSIDPTNGHALYTKLDGTTTDVYSAGDRAFTGKTPYAKYEGGFGMQFTYKGFDLSTDFVLNKGIIHTTTCGLT